MPDSPIQDLDLEVGDWSGSEKDLASKPVETVVTTRGAGNSTLTQREVLADTAHDVKDEAAENVKMGGTANQDHPRNSVKTPAPKSAHTKNKLRTLSIPLS